MKKIAKLNALPAEDQKLILDLCEKHTYPEVAKILAKPRADGGLDLETNRSALSRFYQGNGRFPHNIELAQQFLDVLKANIATHPDTEDLLGPITHLMGMAVFRQMIDFPPFESYQKPLNTYLRLKRMNLENEKLRHAQSKNSNVNTRSNQFSPFHTFGQGAGLSVLPDADAQRLPTPRKNTQPTNSFHGQPLPPPSRKISPKTPVISPISQNSNTSETAPSVPKPPVPPTPPAVTSPISDPAPTSAGATDILQLGISAGVDPALVPILVSAAASGKNVVGELLSRLSPETTNDPAMCAFLDHLAVIESEVSPDISTENPGNLISLTPSQSSDQAKELSGFSNGDLGGALVVGSRQCAPGV